LQWGMGVAEALVKSVVATRGEGKMREIADEFMKLLAVIMILITLAVSTAALGLMLG